AASPPVLDPLPATASPRPRTITGADSWTPSTSRRNPTVREDGAGWGGGETVRPVRTSDPLLRGASAGSSRTRVGVSVRLTTRPGAGSAGALTIRRRAGTARPGPSGAARSERLARSRGRTSGARARGSIGGLRGGRALRADPGPPPPPALPSRALSARSADPRG